MPMADAGAEATATAADPRHVLEHLPCAAWTAGEDGAVDWLNAEARASLGLHGSVARDGWARVVHPGDWAQAEAVWREAVAAGTPYQVRLRLLSPRTGRYHWHVSRARREVDADGRMRWIGINVDVDEPMRGLEVQAASVERLQAERERLRRVFADCPVAITVYEGPDHRIMLMNEANRRIVGGRDLEGRALAEAFPEIAEQGLIDIVDRVRTTGEPYRADELPIEFDRVGDGRMQVGYFSFSLTALEDGDGRAWGVLSSAVDVTEQVHAREALARVAAEREAVLSQLHDGLVLTDLDGRITFVDDRARALYGLATGDAAAPDSGADHAPTVDTPDVLHALRHGAGVPGARWTIRRSDGSRVQVMGDARPLVDTTGRALGAMLRVQPVDAAADPADRMRPPAGPAGAG